MTTNGNNQIIVLDSWENDIELTMGDEPITKPTTKGQEPIIKGDKPITKGQKPISKGDEPITKGQEPIIEKVELEDTEFPSLKQSAKKNDKKFIKKTIPITPKSYNDQKLDEFNNRRTEAFEKLSNKDSLTKSLYKTSICNSVFKKEKCPHGDSCRFAHSISELRTSSCLFCGDCRFVKFNSGKWYNIGNKVCTHIHPEEQRRDFLDRIGVDISIIPMETVNQDDSDTKSSDIIDEKPHVVSPRNKSKIHPIEKVTNAVKNKTLSDVSEELETVIRVPLALSQQALEMALKSGKQNIRVEVI